MNKKTENKMILIESAAVDLRLQSLYDQLNACKTDECVSVTQREIDKLEKKTNWLKVAAALSAAGIGAGALGYGGYKYGKGRLDTVLKGLDLEIMQNKNYSGIRNDQRHNLETPEGIKNLLNNWKYYEMLGKNYDALAPIAGNKKYFDNLVTDLIKKSEPKEAIPDISMKDKLINKSANILANLIRKHNSRKDMAKVVDLSQFDPPHYEPEPYPSTPIKNKQPQNNERQLNPQRWNFRNNLEI